MWQGGGGGQGWAGLEAERVGRVVGRGGGGGEEGKTRLQPSKRTEPVVLAVVEVSSVSAVFAAACLAAFLLGAVSKLENVCTAPGGPTWQLDLNRGVWSSPSTRFTVKTG